MSRRCLLMVCLFLAAAALAAESGSIRGAVTDETGAPLPGVTVEARSAAEPRTATTDRAGRYLLSDLTEGSYEVSFRLPGFAAVTRSGVAVRPREERTLDASLALAATAEVVVTGKRAPAGLADFADAGASLIGIASSATQGTVSGKEVDARPVLRPGDVLETVPGLVVSQHSGEGKANQYYLRGFDLDHGTDFATSVAGVPVNLPSHAHGQGYSDVNFLIPELVSGVRYAKGPYAADQGDFSTAGSAKIDYVTALERSIAKVEGGERGYGRALVAGSSAVAEGTLLWAVEAGHNNGPWVHSDDLRKYNGVLRYSRKSDEHAFSITAMGYRSAWNSTDQVADRAVESGLISRFGSIDPTDGGETHRYSLSAEWQRSGVDSGTRATAYAVDYGLNLFSNFTYFLNDPVNGDQFEQVDRRVVAGLDASQRWESSWLGRDAQTTIGVQLRNDNVAENGLFHTRARAVLGTIRRDHIVQSSGGLYFENNVRWSEKLRTVVGVRGDSYRFRVSADDPANSGSETASLVSPKLSIVLGPWASTELYVNAGYGFHSNDARGTTITEDPKTHEPADRVTPLVRARGAEVGFRSVLVPHLQTTVAFWGLDVGSELVFAGDAGTTEASRPSRRTGVEIANRWSPVRWLVFDADLALSRARFRGPDPAGDRIPGAVESVVSAGASIERLGGFFGSVRLRYFGPRPLVENDAVRSRSSTIVNVQIGYEIARGVRLAANLFNAANARVSDVDYFYASRLPGEPAGGVEDVHSHPTEPRAVRLGVIYSF